MAYPPVDLDLEAIRDRHLDAAIDGFVSSLHGNTFTITQHESLMAFVKNIILESLDYIRISLQDPDLTNPETTMQFAQKTGQFMIDFGLKEYLFNLFPGFKARPEIQSGLSGKNWNAVGTELLSFCVITACIFTILSYGKNPEDFWQNWLKATQGVPIPK
jgi:hypothetical protein